MSMKPFILRIIAGLLFVVVANVGFTAVAFGQSSGRVAGSDSVRVRLRSATTVPISREAEASGSDARAAAEAATVAEPREAAGGLRATEPHAAAEPSGPSTPSVTIARAPITAYVFKANNRPEAVDLEEQSVDLQQGQVLLMQTSDSVKKTTAQFLDRDNALRFELPFRAIYVDRSGQPRESGLVAEIAMGGLRITRDAPGFVGEVFVALVDAKDGTASYQFDSPASLLVTASVDSVAPDRFEIPGTNDWKEVRLAAMSPEDVVPVRIRASVARSGLNIDVPVIRPTMSVSGNPPDVQGLGLEEMTITVAAAGLPNPDGATVSLASTRGKLASTTLKFGPDGVATTTLRSIGAGPFIVTARGDRFADATSDQLKFSWPLAFLLAALLGGIVGAAIGHLQKGKRSGRKHLVRVLLTGALAGLGATVLYAVGVNILPITPKATAGEALVFALALVCGFLGFAIPAAKSKPQSLSGHASPAAS